MVTQTYKDCPACNSEEIRKVLTAEDFTVSHELFEIWECHNCSLRFTQHIPDAASIGDYYRSSLYISHSDSREGVINRIYHAVRRITLRSKRRLIQEMTHVPKGNLLDLGAGTGAFAHEMQSAGWQLTGLEPDASARERARDLYGLYLRPSEELFQLPGASFDVITLWHVLEHVHELHPYLDKIKELLKPGGKCLIAVPNYTSYDASFYKQYWAAYDVPRHLYHFSPSSLKKLLHLHGYKLLTVKPMWFDSFYIAMLSEHHKTGKFHPVKGGCAGLVFNLKALLQKERCSSLVYIIEK